jgi:hypothetical protein
MGSSEFAAFDIAFRRSTGEPEIFMIRTGRLERATEPIVGLYREIGRGCASVRLVEDNLCFAVGFATAVIVAGFVDNSSCVISADDKIVLE